MSLSICVVSRTRFPKLLGRLTKGKCNLRDLLKAVAEQLQGVCVADTLRPGYCPSASSATSNANNDRDTKCPLNPDQPPAADPTSNVGSAIAGVFRPSRGYANIVTNVCVWGGWVDPHYPFTGSSGGSLGQHALVLVVKWFVPQQCFP